jgi:hypothetical protein
MIDFRQKQETVLFSKTPSPVLMSIQLPIYWVLGAFFQA